jgi:hypothetical protein
LDFYAIDGYSHVLQITKAERMNAKQYADLLVLDQGRRPDWTQAAAYVDNEKWSYKRWAWYFLQRNPKYQQVSITTGPKSGERAAAFGRNSLKPYKTPYTQADDENKCWLAERVSAMDGCYVAAGRTVTYELERGEVALVIDLRRTVGAGRAAIAAMLADARSRLDDELAKFEKGLTKSGDDLPEIKKPRRDKLLQRLRMCDAMWKRATDDELIQVFYHGYCENGMLPTGYKRAEVIRKIRREQKAAIAMMESGYLELIPLHYIQDKSSRKVGVLP